MSHGTCHFYFAIVIPTLLFPFPLRGDDNLVGFVRQPLSFTRFLRK